MGEGTLTTKEFVTGLDTETIPPEFTVVFGVAAGEFTVKFGYVPVIVTGPAEV